MKTVLAPNAPWPKPKEEAVMPTPKPKPPPRPKNSASKIANTDKNFVKWAKKNGVKK
jgi:hypothetical protein